MVDEARDVGLPVVELQPALRFTEVAEAVNSELIDRSVARLRHADEVSRTLSEALARGASLSELIEQIGSTLGTWVRLSDYAGRVVVAAGHVDPDDTEPSSEAPVLVEGTAWGRLTVGAGGVAEVLVDAVMDRAPTVLGLCLIREQKDVAGALRAQQLLLDQLATNQSVERGLLEARMRAAGGGHRRARIRLYSGGSSSGRVGGQDCRRPHSASGTWDLRSCRGNAVCLGSRADRRGVAESCARHPFDGARRVTPAGQAVCSHRACGARPVRATARHVRGACHARPRRGPACDAARGQRSGVGARTHAGRAWEPGRHTPVRR